MRRVILCLVFLMTHFTYSFGREGAMEFVVREYNVYDAPTSVLFEGDSYQMILRGDTRDDEMKGVGIFTGHISTDVLSELRGKLKQAPQDEGRFVSKSLVDKYVKRFFREGQRLCKLDAKIDVIPSRNGGLLVTIKFINSGNERIVFENPATWEGESNRILGSSNIAVLGKPASSNQSEDVYFLIDDVGGAQLANPGASDAGSFLINPGQVRSIEFVAFPDKPIKRGEYIIAANISIKRIMEPALLSGVVEFASLSSHVNFSRDYPSTPEEIKAFNAYLKAHP